MPIRVRVRLESRERGEDLEALAPLNTGFTSDSLDIHLPIDAAGSLELWPPPPNSVLETLDTAGDRDPELLHT